MECFCLLAIVVVSYHISVLGISVPSLLSLFFYLVPFIRHRASRYIFAETKLSMKFTIHWRDHWLTCLSCCKALDASIVHSFPLNLTSSILSSWPVYLFYSQYEQALAPPWRPSVSKMIKSKKHISRHTHLFPHFISIIITDDFVESSILNRGCLGDLHIHFLHDIKAGASDLSFIIPSDRDKSLNTRQDYQIQ